MLKVNNLTVESLINPVGLYTMKPWFSWVIETDMAGAVQESYRIEVTGDDGGLVWDSGDVNSDNSVFVDYAGPGLQFETRYFWRVMVTVNGSVSDWSEKANFETALEKWTASFIATDDNPRSSEVKALRRCIDISNPVKSARIYATALGLYEIEIDGEPITDTCFNPGWTSYNERVLYQAFDVTDKLKQGDNEITAHLAVGWYKGDMGFQNSRNLFGDKMAFSAQISVRYDDGTDDVLYTDETWEYADSAITYSEIYHGEIYDARLETAPKDWKKAQLFDAGSRRIEPTDGVPVRRQEILKPIKFITTPKGERVLDFGQNLTGRVRFHVDGKNGDTVRLRHAEVLDKDGNFYTENLRSARCTDTYICKDGKQSFEPHFTFHGFRYICIDEYPGAIDMANFEAVVIHSDMRKTGEFKCSDNLINQLQSNITWGLKGNFLDIPTDCPQRDERLGWTGDAQIFIHAASYLYDVLPFFRKWLRDLALDQKPDGGVPFVIPDTLKNLKDDKNIRENHSSCAWGDAAVIIPWTLFEAFGDKRILEAQYESMKGWISYIESKAVSNLWNTGFHFADWVALDAREGDYKGATPDDLCATAYYAYSTELLAKAAAALGKAADAERYSKLHNDIKQAYANEFFTANGRLAVPTQTAHIVSLMFGLTPESFILRVTEDLVKLIESNGGHLVTGFIGTPYFCHALSRNNRLEEAYKLLQREDYPSWLYQVKMGATTIWEHLDGIKPGGSMWSADMNSFNHYAYGAIGDWLYKVVTGINPLEPGYKKILIEPKPGGTLTWAEGRLQTPYGEVISRWDIKGDGIEYSVVIPPNTTAEIRLPNGSCYNVLSGKYNYIC